jgi:hypothetical protein
MQCLCPSQEYRHKLAAPKVYSLFCDASVATAYGAVCCAMLAFVIQVYKLTLTKVIAAIPVDTLSNNDRNPDVGSLHVQLVR